ncbi:hypothetical protein HMI55_000998 [Coelomomyces lativittatus]|nr:hypothetical protein HMI55_000998 [Coelomomyces lativittatus]
MDFSLMSSNSISNSLYGSEYVKLALKDCWQKHSLEFSRMTWGFICNLRRKKTKKKKKTKTQLVRVGIENQPDFSVNNGKKLQWIIMIIKFLIFKLFFSRRWHALKLQ